MRFIGALDSVRERLRPVHLKADAIDAISDQIESAKEGVRTAIRQHPILTASAAAGGLVLIFWRPVRLVLLYGMRGAWMVWLNRALWSNRHDK